MEKHSILKGVIKGIKYAIVFLIAGLTLGLPPEWRELTVAGALVFILNTLKVRWGLKIP